MTFHEIVTHEVTVPTIMLGSTQRDDVVDRGACERAGVRVERRRGGGGAVWLAPGEVVWVDVIVPAGAPGWTDDVTRSMDWLGERLAAAFRDVGVFDAVAHREGMVSTEYSRLVCFDGLGPGEVTLDGAKLVGVSQRRTRTEARLQCCWYTTYRSDDLTRLLVADIDGARLRPVAIVDAAPAREVIDALRARLS